MKDGDYQSCLGCHAYASCVAGRHENRTCAPSGLVWDDNKKKCEYTSTTCSAEDNKVEIKPAAADTNTCVSDCNGMKNGDYQSCLGCHVYATCSNEILYDNRPCPADLVWDDNKKRCEYTSSICNSGGSTGDCVSDCTGMKNGDYQSCLGCNVYATCSNEILYDNRPCPANLVWDDNKKRCEWYSSTCTEAEGDQNDGNAEDNNGGDDDQDADDNSSNDNDDSQGNTGNNCVSDCTGVANGDYQSCLGCHVYATCSNEILYDNRPCPADLVWDDNKKRCEYTSLTCNSGGSTGDCVSDCTGMKNGDYQSCLGCNVYATCSNEILYDNRPCPANLVWDDNKKRCEWYSSTCTEAEGDQNDGNAEDNNGDDDDQDADDNSSNDNDDSQGNTGNNCVSDCTGVANGDYQSCLGCHVYATCSNEILYDNRSCPADLVWDDNKKRCEYTSLTCNSGGSTGDCVSDCTGMKNGDYQSCLGCNVYATCSNEILYDNRPCPANLVWDDNKKRCEWYSSTCTEAEGDQNDGNAEDNNGGDDDQDADDNSSNDNDDSQGNTGNNCVSDCTGVANGDYQSCLGCHVYATCSNEILYDNRPCPADLVWDDNKKRCEYTSLTCNSGGSTGDCVSDCTGMKNGDYQSCLGCNVYATCSNEILYDNRPCPANLVWDDNKKRCEWYSSTCTEAEGDQNDGNAEDNNGGDDDQDADDNSSNDNDDSQGNTGNNCVSDCTGVANGDYQSCLGCHVYATCSNEILYDNRPCPADLVWDDNKKRCEYTSLTCNSGGSTGDCVSDCTGMKNGDYQSCLGCNVYATCSNEILYDNRPCPANLVWDDNKKRCEWYSSTCTEAEGDQNDGNAEDNNGDDDDQDADDNSSNDNDDSQGNTGNNCVSDCTGVANGDYQSCLGCHVYATCSNEILYDNRSCPADLVWDDNKKRCEYTSLTCNSGGSTGDCVSDCTGMKNGDYQSCLGCNVYATCSNEILYDNRPCPANLVWDDNKKRCEWYSSTCTEAEGDQNDGNAEDNNGGDDDQDADDNSSNDNDDSQGNTGNNCVSDCTGVANGDYQSCLGCHVYATCSNEILYDNRPCPADLVWDDNKKRCEYTSLTCNSGGSTGDCVSDCTGMKNGDYQSCLGCNVYATCSNEILYDNRPCPANLVWDDNKKRCEWYSSTCTEAEGDQNDGNAEDNNGGDDDQDADDNSSNDNDDSQGNTGNNCVSDCTGVANGDYQSCLGCHVYATCSNEILYDNRSCPADLVWDDNKKRCEYTSLTCNSGGSTGDCVSDCTGMKNGDYQSCLGCNVYATCSNEILYDNRPCPADLVWDDNLKKCMYTSNTCCDDDGNNGGDANDDGDDDANDDNNDGNEGDDDTNGGTGNCVSSCEGVPNGDYQSCLGCNVYATCSNEILYDNRPCPADLVWDDNKKRCEYTSTTCSSGGSNGNCVSSCVGVANGDYQSCLGCNVYATCSNEILYDNRPCPADLVWDDNKKRCEYTSSTCSEISVVEEETVTGNTGDSCITSCEGVPNGDYQSCEGCSVFATCSNGQITDNRPCPPGLVWDDTLKTCASTSSTCSESDSGSGAN